MPFSRRRLLEIAGALLGAGPAIALGRGSTPKPEAPPLVLARVWDGRIDPALCLVSEKLDGVRAVWDGRHLRHRSGRPVAAPAWFLERLPPVPLDGELWFGRGQFEALSGAVRTDPPDDAAWRRVRYRIFELPGGPGPFAARAAEIERICARAAWPGLDAVAQTRVADDAALRRRLDAVVAQGGEGLMLHLASALYAAGRGPALSKLKPFLDAEARVVGHRTGTGRLAGATGALEVETPEGRRFFLGTGLGDALRREPPGIGSVVTYRYRDRTGSGLPRFASFLRLHVEP